jgi:hypothetical protein
LTTQRFTATVMAAGSRTFIELPFDPHVTWGVKQRHHVNGAIDGHRVRAALRSQGDGYVLPLGAAWLRDCGIGAGATVEVVLSPEGPQSQDLAPDIADALAAEPQAEAFFLALATFYRTTFLRWIDGGTRSGTRAARIAEMISLLKQGKKQR